MGPRQRLFAMVILCHRFETAICKYYEYKNLTKKLSRPVLSDRESLLIFVGGRTAFQSRLRPCQISKAQRSSSGKPAGSDPLYSLTARRGLSSNLSSQ